MTKLGSHEPQQTALFVILPHPQPATTILSPISVSIFSGAKPCDDAEQKIAAPTGRGAPKFFFFFELSGSEKLGGLSLRSGGGCEIGRHAVMVCWWGLGRFHSLRVRKLSGLPDAVNRGVLSRGLACMQRPGDSTLACCRCLAYYGLPTYV